MFNQWKFNGQEASRYLFRLLNRSKSLCNSYRTFRAFRRLNKITRFLNSKETTSKDLWEYIKPEIRKIEQDTGGVLILDDTIEEKTYTDENEIICRHYSHAKKRCVKGVNLLSCLVRYGDIALPIACEAICKD